MIKECSAFELPEVNNLLKTFNYKITKECLNNNKFMHILIFEDCKGILIYDYIYDRIEIEYIIVKSQYRRKGIATKLLKFMELQYNNIKNITLEVNESNEAAIKFYEQSGFMKVAVRKNYYEAQNGFLMIKKIGD